MRLALPLAIVTPALFAAACGDNIHPDDGDTSTVQSDNGGAPDAGVDADIDADAPDADAAARQIRAELVVTSPECFDAVAAYEVRAFYVDDNSPVTQLECHLAFDNSGSADSCVGRHDLGEGGEHAFNVDIQDLATGAVAHADLRRVVDMPLRPDFDFDLHSCGLHMDFNLSAPMAQTRVVTVTSADGALSERLGDSGGYDFAAYGNYTLTAYVEQERPVGPICSLTIPYPITISACDHEHGPSCADW
jgi:hypothetical protein